MNKRTSILALSVLLLLAAGCNIDDPVSLGPAVYGTVLDAATQQPIEGATVSVGGRMAMSTIPGNYYVPDVPRGTHVLQVTKAGYATYSIEVTVDGMVQKNVQLTK